MNKFLLFAILFVLTTAQSSDKLKLDLYVESQCPDCKQFMTGQVSKALQTPGLDQIFEINVFPYGNAQESQSGSQYVYTCQHGAVECYGNLIETCALKYVTDKNLALNFLICLESYIDYYGDFDQTGQYCSSYYKIANYNDINACANGNEGNQLEHQMALATDALNPSHQYVPWLVANGVHTEDMQNQAQTDLVQFICSNYHGSIVVPACQQKNEVKLVDTENKVQIDLYDETLCPACQNFVSYQIDAALKTADLNLISDINIYTYGNAQQQQLSNGSYQFTCQHGEQECYGNLMMNCASKYVQKPQLLQLQVCIEQKAQASIDFDTAIQTCAPQLSISNVDQIYQCMNSDEGNQLVHQTADKTEQLNPPHQYVPWIVVNGQHTEDMENACLNNLVQYICQTYTGTVKVAACAQYKRSYKNVEQKKIQNIQKSYVSDKVQLELYHESLCPYCKQFITTQISRLVASPNLFNIVDVQLYPYGNAKETQNNNQYVYTCQHGAEECNGNLIETCSKYHLDNLAYINFTLCLENNIDQYSTFNKTAIFCQNYLNVPAQSFSAIENCVATNEGNNLQHQIAQQTSSLNPPHAYVPWIVVNGQHTDDIQNQAQDDLVKYICQNYNGTQVVPECSQYKNQQINSSQQNTFLSKYTQLKKTLITE